jgi:chemotaxis protein CheY-P-specific phosphatase CheC
VLRAEPIVQNPAHVAPRRPGRVPRGGIQRALNALALNAAGRASRDLELLLMKPVELAAHHVELKAVAGSGVGAEPWPRRVLVVHQTVAGALRGDLSWVAGEAAAANLLETLGIAPQRPGPLTTLEREALTEIGNVVVSAIAEVLAQSLQLELRTLAPSFAAGAPDDTLHPLRRAAAGSEFFRFWLEGSVGGQRIDQAMLLLLDPVSVPWFKRHLAARGGVLPEVQRPVTGNAEELTR